MLILLVSVDLNLYLRITGRASDGYLPTMLVTPSRERRSKC